MIALNSVINLGILKNRYDSSRTTFFLLFVLKRRQKCKIYFTESQLNMFASFCFIADVERISWEKHISHKRFPSFDVFPLSALISHHEKFRQCTRGIRKRSEIIFDIDVRINLTKNKRETRQRNKYWSRLEKSLWIFKDSLVGKRNLVWK